MDYSAIDDKPAIFDLCWATWEKVNTVFCHLFALWHRLKIGDHFFRLAKSQIILDGWRGWLSARHLPKFGEKRGGCARELGFTDRTLQFDWPNYIIQTAVADFQLHHVNHMGYVGMKLEFKKSLKGRRSGSLSCLARKVEIQTCNHSQFLRHVMWP